MTTTEQEPTPESHVNSWCFGEGLDDEGASIIQDGFATREDAIVAGRAYYDDGSSFHTAYKRWMHERPPSPFFPMGVLDDALENAEWHENVAENWMSEASEHTRDLGERLDGLWEQWCKDHKLEAWLIYLDDVELTPMVAVVETVPDVVTSEAP